MVVDAKVAAALLQAERTSSPLPLPPGDIGVREGYLIQEIGREMRCDAGTRHVGYKVGLTSPAAQSQRRIDHPVYGYLLDRRVVDVQPLVTMPGLVHPRIEIEVAFAFHRSLEGDVDRDEVLSATSHLMLAIEVVDSRWQQPAGAAGTLIADNVSGAGAILGSPFPVGSRDLTTVDVTATIGTTQVNGNASNVLGDPARAVAWLARELAQRGGRIHAGDIVLSGSLCTPTPIQRTERVVADFGALGSLATQLAW